MPDRPTRVTERLGGGAGRSTPSESRAGPAEAAGPYDGPDLGVEETLLTVLRGIGAVMFLTSQRLIIARDGVERRPRSGIVSYPLAAISHLRLELGSAPSGRIAVWTGAGQEAVSMFFDARSLERAHELIDTARPLVARQRRRGPGARPVRPSSGPADSGSRKPARASQVPDRTDVDDNR